MTYEPQYNRHTFHPGFIGPAPAVVPFSGVLSTDSFNRANSSTTLGSTDGTGHLDPIAWTYPYGEVWGIDTNQAKKQTAGSSGAGEHFAVIDLGVSDMDVSIVTAVRVVANGAGLCFRFVDSSHYWLYRNSNLGSTQLILRNGGGEAVQASDSGGTEGDTLRVVATGSSLTCYRNGVLKQTLTDGALSTATMAGLVDSASAGGNRWDSWSASTA